MTPLGMESEIIADSSITASTVRNNDHHAHFGRPNTQRGSSKSWCSSPSDLAPYLQVDLGERKAVCGVGTQGRGILDRSVYYPMRYSVQLSNESSNWMAIHQYRETKVGIRVNNYRLQPLITEEVRPNWSLGWGKIQQLL